MTTAAEPPTAPRENRDGRVARGERTRRAIVEAHADLLRGGTLRPTAKLIAERAGISLRTLWLNFGDMESLMVHTSQYWLDRDAANAEVVSPDLPLAERIDTWCAARARRMEDLLPAAASALLVEPFSEALGEARRRHWARLHQDLARTFGAEAGDGADPETATPLHMSLIVASNAMSWLVLRRDEQLSFEQAVEVMRSTFVRLLMEQG